MASAPWHWRPADVHPSGVPPLTEMGTSPHAGDPDAAMAEAPTAQVAALEARVRGLEFALRLFAVVSLLVFWGVAMRRILAAPKFKSVFRDLLGSVEKLPDLTKAFLYFANHPLLAFGVPLACLVTGLVGSRLLPRSRGIVMVFGALAALGLIVMIANTALGLPMFNIIQGIYGN